MRGNLRRAAPLLLLLAVLVAGVVVFGPPGQDRELPLQPSSTAADGTKALVEILRELGADVAVVERPVPPGTADTQLVLVDNLPAAGRARLRGFVRAGGTLVLADPDSPLAPDVVGAFSLAPSRLRPACTLEALADVSVRVPPGPAFDPAPGSVGCYPRGSGFLLVADPLGDGVVVALPGPGLFTNALVGDADNAVLAAALLAPRPGSRVAIVRPDFAATSAQPPGLSDLVAPPVRWALLQLLVAYVLVVAWRARRLGKPVEEELPVRLPGSELVVAVGNLLQTGRRRRRAAALLRAEARRRLERRLPVPAGLPAEQLASAAAGAGLDGEGVFALLRTEPPDETALVTLAQQLEALVPAAPVPGLQHPSAPPAAELVGTADPPTRKEGVLP